MKYNGHENLKASGTGGAGTKTKGRKTTYEERGEIVKYCIEHEMNYAQTLEKYQVSYQQIYQWTKNINQTALTALLIVLHGVFLLPVMMHLRQSKISMEER